MGGHKNQQKRTQELEFIRRTAEGLRKGIVTGPAAARLRGISTLNWVEQVDVVYLSNCRARAKPKTDDEIVHRNGKITADDVTVHDGVRVTSLIHTLFDSYRYHGRREALVQIESARWKWPSLTVEELLERTKTLPRAKGLAGFRELIRGSAESSQSPLETLLRDGVLQAIASGQLTGVETLEFQAGFRIRDRDGNMTVAWADVLINGFLFLEGDGEEKTSGAMGDAVEAINRERHREKQLQNEGAVFERVGWRELNAPEMIRQLQRHIDYNPGVRRLPNRVGMTHRQWQEQKAWRRAS